MEAALQAKPKYFETALPGAERQRLYRQRKADRERHTAELIAELLATVPEDVAARLTADERYNEIITAALLR
ncbi:hypothetical protein [Azospirillum doebereinerae]|uniref:Uncharacterized protein n=1 Tax=Azospirillum doebereinerae TaxID=92933 RepID=A0A3S0WK52_9PROT|nr:hypothetical protein [Azospirillum doebereinerae]RUQ67472.1 hypothetical protein EJ913_19820 [Azospirillum doebereinerae]